MNSASLHPSEGEKCLFKTDTHGLALLLSFVAGERNAVMVSRDWPEQKIFGADLGFLRKWGLIHPV